MGVFTVHSVLNSALRAGQLLTTNSALCNEDHLILLEMMCHLGLLGDSTEVTTISDQMAECSQDLHLPSTHLSYLAGIKTRYFHTTYEFIFWFPIGT